VKKTRALSIYFDADDMSGVEIRVSDMFRNCDGLARADVLKDALALLQDAYDDAVDDLHADMRRWAREGAKE
jgi:hypothetical protein